MYFNFNFNFNLNFMLGAIVLFLTLVMFTVAILTLTHAYSFSIPFVCSTDDLSTHKLHVQTSGVVSVCITSGGCHPLDRCMVNEAVYTCDTTASQNHLLELKIAVIRELPYETFWRMFGIGRVENGDIWRSLQDDYAIRLRPLLSEDARAFWDARMFYFRDGLYRCGSAQVALSTRLCRRYWPSGHASFVQPTCLSPSRQLELCRDPAVRRMIATYGLFHWVGRRMPLTGVVSSQWADDDPAEVLLRGLVRRASVPASFCHDYVTRMYVTGSFVPRCCPEYMRPENYALLRSRVSRITILRGSFLDALRQIHRADEFIPLDHMDCLPLPEVDAEAIEMRRLTAHLPPGTPIAVVKCVSESPVYVTRSLARHFDVEDVTADLRYDGSDLYMVQRAYVLRARGNEELH
jgi:S-adenosylmethionine-diacylglycerol 3-amino-3-carboxypropyl transferase